MVMEHLRAYPFRVAVSTLKLLTAGHVFYTHFYQFSACSGPSMLPSLSITGDWLFIDVTHRRNRLNELRVGDVVSYHIPMTRRQSGVKRIIGMPGDYVCPGTPGESGQESMLQVRRNWPHPPQGARKCADICVFLVQVPEGHCWLVGDNLTASRDSRIFGPLPLALVQGKVICRFWPFRERGWISNGMERIDN